MHIQMQLNYLLIRDILIITLNSLLVYYVLKLETDKCTCSDDWRREYIKYYTLIIIGYIMFSFTFPVIRAIKLIQISLMIVGIVNIYCVYTYMRALLESNCVCAVKEHPNLHEFFMFESLISVILVCISVIFMISVIMSTYMHGFFTMTGYTKLGKILDSK